MKLSDGSEITIAFDFAGRFQHGDKVQIWGTSQDGQVFTVVETRRVRFARWARRTAWRLWALSRAPDLLNAIRNAFRDHEAEKAESDRILAEMIARANQVLEASRRERDRDQAERN